MTVDIRRTRVPDTLDDPAIADLTAAVALRNADSLAVHGNDAHDMTVAQMLEHWQDSTHFLLTGFVAEDTGEIVGSVGITLPQAERSRTASINVRVAAKHRGRGVGEQPYEVAVEFVREQGRDVLQSWTDHAASELDTLPANTGFGSVPLDASARFAQRHDYALEQVYVVSHLDVAARVDDVRALRTEARDAAGADYAFHWWESPTSDENIDDLALLQSRLATDAPAGDLEIEDAAWDADRIRRIESRDTAGNDRRFYGAICHLSSGRLVALNELVINREKPSFAHQHTTLVLREHRGHRLGLLVKCETLLRTLQAVPELSRIETHNAAENSYMLAINEQMGFAPARFSGEWQRDAD